MKGFNKGDRFRLEKDVVVTDSSQENAVFFNIVGGSTESSIYLHEKDTDGLVQIVSLPTKPGTFITLSSEAVNFSEKYVLWPDGLWRSVNWSRMTTEQIEQCVSSHYYKVTVD